MNNAKMFKKYVERFDFHDINISRKYWHSLRVRDYSKILAQYLNLDEKDTEIAMFIGLTHDLGRFVQWKVFENFCDECSIDHALLSSFILFDKDLNIGFDLPEDSENIIRKAIYNHNKYAIDSDLDDRERLFAKIIRDADKIDILYLLEESALVLEEDGKDVSASVHDYFWNYKTVRINDCVTDTDKVLLKMAFVFDFNFGKSYEIIQREKMLDNFYEKLKYKSRYEKYYLHAKEYIASKVAEFK